MSSGSGRAEQPVTKSSVFIDRQREASALEKGGTGAKRGGMGLLLTALCAGVIGGGIIAGALFAAVDAQSHVPRGGMAMSTSASAPDRVVGPYGRGGGEVWLVLPNAPLRSVVVFGHGWKLTSRSPGHPWVDQFRPWLDHLAARGSAVIFPSYQLGSGDAADAMRVRDWAAAIQTGYVRLGRPKVPFVAVGYSFGASLAFYYAASARTWRLPVPRAVQAIFPAGMIAGALLPALAPSVRVLVQVGDADTEAGRGGADAFWNWLSSHPAALKSYEVIHSTPQFAATHAAPKSTSPAARRAFWAPLDRLIALARGA